MEPWEIREDETRDEDSRKVFIIFCEDGAIEPAYFETFKRKGVQVSPIGNAKQHHAQIDFATEFFRKNGLIEVDNEGNEFLKIDDGAQVWSIFDRDKSPDDGKDTAFNDSIRSAKAKGIKTGWSNDAFELWILLHFEDVDIENSEYYHRSKYYERLTEILKNRFPDETIFQNPKFDYYETMKTKKNFIRFTFQLMKGNLNKAIERAESEVYPNIWTS